MTNREYWEQRGIQRLLESEQQALTFERLILNNMQEVYNAIDAEIYKLYAKYAIDNKVEYKSAVTYLTDNEREEFRHDIEFYLSKINDEQYRTQHRQYLQALSVRARVSRLEAYKASLKMLTEPAFKELESGGNDLLGKLYKDRYYKSIFDSQTFAGHYSGGFAMAPESAIKNLIQYPWSGKNYSQKVWDNADALQKALDTTLTQGIIQGLSVQDMCKRFSVAYRGAGGKGGNDYRIKGLIRTEANFFANAGATDGYDAAGFDSYDYLATLDLKVCERCSKLDKKTFKNNEKRPGVNYPPIHTRCRCTTIPHVDDLDGDIPAKRVHRDPNTGKSKIIEDMNYNKWKDRYLQPNNKKGILTDKEEHAVNSYISGDSYKINVALRSGKPLNPELQDIVTNLESALDKMPKYKGVVYRSMTDDDIPDTNAFISLHKPGNLVSCPAFTSTSTDVYDDNMPIQYIINSKSGADLRKYNPGEKEVLFNRNTSFFVTKVEGNTIYMEED